MRARALGLQGWLVAAFLAVGALASLAVLLVLLPALESNVREDRAKLESDRLAASMRTALRGVTLNEPLTVDDLRLLAQEVRAATGADIRMTYRPGLRLLRSETTVQAPSSPTATDRLDEAARQPRGYSTDGRLIAPLVRFEVPGSGGQLLVRGARTLSGVAPELAVVRQRVLLAMAVVLGLASLAGVLLARLLGGRLRRLAHTAATLSRGDLSARSPELGTVPEELVILRQSLDGMAARLQSFVGAITDERDRDRAMIGSLAEGVLAVGVDDTVTVANDAAGRMLGLPEGVESARLASLPPAVMDAVRASRAGSPGADEPRQIVLRDGQELELYVSQMAARDGAASVVTLRDVTDQRRTERVRRDLVANVSHELKTPIAALKGFLELLEDEGMRSQDRREFLGAMTQETARLERLVEEQLELARLDAGALPLELADVDLARLVHQVVEARVALAEREGVRMVVVSAEEGTLVLADEARIEQVLLILLDNAVRHTPAGGEVAVSVSAGGQDAILRVSDTGEGIAPGDLPFIFDRFYRGDPSRKGRSAGLGLAIARGLIAAHRGTIEVESTPGTGTTFTVTLPLASAGPVTVEEPIPARLAARTSE